MSEFTCIKCKITYKKINNEEWNEFKAAEELLTLYPEAKNDAVDVLCDVCVEEFRKWFATLSEEDKRKMREEYE